jgi:MoCo/4Fe-4S cofactor protein with predicted Tat translocation signal
MSKQNTSPQPFDLDALRARLAEARGPEFWRSLEEAAAAPEFQAWVDNEFAPGASEWSDPVSRRRLMQLLGASLGLAGLTACTKQPEERIVPYVQQPEQIVPGKPLFFATSTLLSGYAHGVLAESHMGRPTKIEGNPDHPSSLGGTDVFSQAQTLMLYDPDRLQAVLREGRISSWDAFLSAMEPVRTQIAEKKGEGFHILTETITSPSIAAMIRAIKAEFPGMQWHQYDPVSLSNSFEGTRVAFGEPVSVVYDLTKADVILSLDADFLTHGPGAMRYARDYARRRNPKAGGGMNRLYVVESCPSPTGAMAEHRLAMTHCEIDIFARALAARCGVQTPAAAAEIRDAKWLDAVAEDLLSHRGRCVVIPGDHQPPAVHALAHAINVTLGNAGQTVHYVEPVEAEPVDHYTSLSSLVSDMNAGRVETLLVLGGNPVYSAPGDLGFLDAYRKVKLRIRLGYYDDETSAYSHWVIPEAHTLEMWGDARGHDGSISLIQPLIAPLYEGKTCIEILAIFRGQGVRTSHDLLLEFWRNQRPGPDFESFWRKSLHDGVIAGSAARPRSVALRSNLAGQLPPLPETSKPEIQIRPDSTIYDGRFANNGWLQELPKKITRTVWDNAALMSPRMAQTLGVRQGDVVDLRAAGRSLKLPAFIQPGHPDDAVTVHLGYGRRRGGKLGAGIGGDANLLRTAKSPWVVSGAEVRRTGERYNLVSTQNHHSMEGRGLVRSASLKEFEHDPEHAFHLGHHGPGGEVQLFPQREYKGYAWGMVIDLNACIGCDACTIACQAENNIAVVGKREVDRGREMHWIRVDRYFSGELDHPDIYHQPVPCMHCENAPCEVVCPVAATVHSDEGLNHMVYNRCVGTRYCSNNCPYKVRRFNFYLYSDWDTKSLHGLRNPNVTVRSRGVMEKCTYCVQRINAARIAAELEGRRIKDGEVVTACQAACPAEAIHFGDINDPESKVARLKNDPRNYTLLDDLNVRPRTSYLGQLRNPNPVLEKPKPDEGHGGSRHTLVHIQPVRRG